MDTHYHEDQAELDGTSRQTATSSTSILTVRIPTQMKDDLLDLAAREMVDLSVVARHALAVFCGYDPARIRRRRTIRERPVRIVQAPAHTDVALLSSIASIDQELQVIVQESAVGRCSELVREVHEIIDDLHALMPGLESLIGLPHEQQ